MVVAKKDFNLFIGEYLNKFSLIHYTPSVVIHKVRHFYRGALGADELGRRGGGAGRPGSSGGLVKREG